MAEVLTDWDNVPEEIQKYIGFIFYKKLRGRGKASLSEIFDLAKPKVVNIDDWHSWRIDKDQGLLLTKLIAEYY